MAYVTPFLSMDNTVSIIFENASQAEAFMRWFDRSGEQEYFTTAELSGHKAYVDKFKYDFMNRVIIGETINEQS